jgi:multicomponent Na+:H+ antiporter subunit D
VFRVAFDFETLPITEIVVVFSVLAMLVASLIAVLETDLKRMLAYSSVAQIGYITLGVGLVDRAGLTGGVVHVLNHALMKAALFLAIGAIVYRVGTVRLDDLAGIGRRMPITMVAFTVAGLGLVGTPGTAGFISKWYLAVGALDRGWWPILAVIVTSSLIALVYVGRVLEVTWMREPSAALAEARDPPPSMLLPILVLAGATIYFGIQTEWSAGLAGKVAEHLLGGRR